MSKWVRRTSIALVALALLGAVTGVVGKALEERKMARNIALQVAPLDVSPDPARIEHGRYLYNTRGCAECHGADGAGKAFIKEGAYVANSCTGCRGASLTPGKGSAMARYPTPEAFMAMLRSGRRPDGSAVSPVMPFGSLRQMNDTDMRALYTYLASASARARPDSSDQ